MFNSIASKDLGIALSINIEMRIEGGNNLQHLSIGKFLKVDLAICSE